MGYLKIVGGEYLTPTYLRIKEGFYQHTNRWGLTTI